jgi:hypothetical protein
LPSEPEPGVFRTTAATVPHPYDFGRFETLVVIGGGDVTLPAQEGLTGRVGLETGDFFASAPADGDLYLLKSIIHDWDHERCAAVLRHIRDVIPAHGSLLIA